MQVRLRTLAGLCALAVADCAFCASAQTPPDPLAASFSAPPESARPRVWWHWMNGNITKDGVKADLEWMQRVGIGGVQIFDASLGTPKLVDVPLSFMTPSWKDAFRYAVTLADQLGMEVAIAGSPGWSESGGPWVRPGQGMKKLVWSETRIAGGRAFKGVLTRPPATVGPFQNVRINWNTPFGGGKPAEPVPDLYQDVATIAYRLPADDRSIAELHPAVTTSAGSVDAELLWDNDYERAVKLPYAPAGHSAWIQVDFGRPQRVQSVTLALQGNSGMEFLVDRSKVAADLESSVDGTHYDPVASIHETAAVEQTLAFQPVTARYFRLSLPTPVPTQFPPLFGSPAAPPRTDHLIAEFLLHAAPRVDRFEEKAGFFVDSGIGGGATPPGVESREALRKEDIVDLSSRLQPDGTLSWSPPAGRWAILRIGYSLLGVTNRPASAAATGLEVDKLSRSNVKLYMDDYLALYEGTLGKDLIGGRGLRAMVNDSWETGAQNWTDDLPGEFLRRRGYDLRPWLPALTGRIIGSAAATDKFLWDFRRTLGDALTDNHYGQIASSLHQRNMIHYGESHESGRAFIGDGMDVKRDDDIPMGAMWVKGFAPQEQYDADIRESASVAHIYGQNLVAAESMTSVGFPGTAFAFSPRDLKPTVDRELADGLNRFVIHTSVHQPLNREGPGITLGPFGQWFTREETWAEQAAPWVSYLSRSSYLLQQGHFVADVIYYYGQDSNITALYAKHLPAVPEGYAFDFANAHALTMLSVRDGNLVTASGMSYRVLALDPRARVMSMDVLEQISRLVMAGATVVGDKPESTPSLADDDAEFQALADRVWGSDAPHEAAPREHQYGQGRVITGKALSDVLAELRIDRDFGYTRPAADTTLWFVHRRLPDGDLYFVNNRQDRPEQLEVNFRVAGKEPELWHADTGKIEPVSYRVDGRHTLVRLSLDANDAVFVVFRRDSRLDHRDLSEPARTSLAAVAGPWKVHFQASRGAPDSVTWAELKSWSTDATPGIKYFSGTASYQTSVRAPRAWIRAGHRIILDLGVVKNLAEVIVNGETAGVLWKPPFVVDVTDLLHQGDNSLVVRVTNLWPNRLIGDRQSNAAPVAFATYNPYSPNFPLLESGLLGPVQILRSAVPNVRE